MCRICLTLLLGGIYQLTIEACQFPDTFIALRQSQPCILKLLMDEEQMVTMHLMKCKGHNCSNSGICVNYDVCFFVSHLSPNLQFTTLYIGGSPKAKSWTTDRRNLTNLTPPPLIASASIQCVDNEKKCSHNSFVLPFT